MAHEQNHYLLKLTFDPAAIDSRTNKGTLQGQLYQIANGAETLVPAPEDSTEERCQGSHTFHPGDEAAVEVIDRSGRDLGSQQLYLIFDFSRTSAGQREEYGPSPFEGEPANSVCVFELEPAKKAGHWRPKNVVGRAKTAGEILTRNLSDPKEDPGAVAWDFDIRLELYESGELTSTFVFDPEMIVDPWG